MCLFEIVIDDYASKVIVNCDSNGDFEFGVNLIALNSDINYLVIILEVEVGSLKLDKIHFVVQVLKIFS